MTDREIDESNPWQTVSTKLIYENPWIRVREDAVIRPDGKPGIYGVVETRIATGVVALGDANEVYMVGQYRYPIGRYSWEIIEGGAEVGEDPFAAIQRELEEEAGLIAAEWIQLGERYHLSNCFSNEYGMIYLARGLEQRQARPEGTEVLAVRKVPFESALAMVDSGEITDGLTIVGLLRAERYLNGNDTIPVKRLR